MPNTYTQIYVQVVFAVNGRQSLITPSFKEDLFKYIGGTRSPAADPASRPIDRRLLRSSLSRVAALGVSKRSRKRRRNPRRLAAKSSRMSRLGQFWRACVSRHRA
jgi:hypothetical protein